MTEGDPHSHAQVELRARYAVPFSRAVADGLCIEDAQLTELTDEECAHHQATAGVLVLGRTNLCKWLMLFDRPQTWLIAAEVSTKDRTGRHIEAQRIVIPKQEATCTPLAPATQNQLPSCASSESAIPGTAPIVTPDRRRNRKPASPDCADDTTLQAKETVMNNSAMTNEQYRLALVRLYNGREYGSQAHGASLLGLTVRTIRRQIAGDLPVTDQTARLLRLLIWERAKGELDEAKRIMQINLD